MPGRIFVSYRRDASAAAAGRLADRLIQHFDRDQVFIDVESIEPGIDFVTALNDQVAQCSAFLVVIGPGWADVKDSAGQRRLDDPGDYVRIEIETAMKRDIRIVPVLVDGARMVTFEELPETLKPLARRQALEITHHRFGTDADELARVLERASGLRPKHAAQESVIDRGPASPSVTWAEFLFSFRGRISRKQYFLSALGLTVVCGLLASAIIIAFAVAIGDSALLEPKDGRINPPRAVLAIYYIASLPMLWPCAAIYMKRLHDFGQGSGLFWITLIGTFPLIGAQLAGYEELERTMWAAALAVWIVIGCIKGTPGPNEFGPDPLARDRQSSKSPQSAAG